MIYFIKVTCLLDLGNGRKICRNLSEGLMVMNGFGRTGVAPEPKIHKVSGRGFLYCRLF